METIVKCGGAVQGILGHSKIQTTLDINKQEDRDATRAARGEFPNAVRMSTAVASSDLGSTNEVIAEHRQPTFGLPPASFIFNDIPMLDENSVLDT